MPTSADRIVIAAMLTTAVLGGSMLALAHARLEHEAELPVIDPGVAVPIAVRPVADLPGGGAKIKGRRTKKAARAPSRPRDDAQPSPIEPAAEASVPQAWRRQAPKPGKPSARDLPWPLPEPEAAHDSVDDAAAADPSSAQDSGESPDKDPSADSEGPEGSQTEGRGGGSNGGEGEGEGGGSTTGQDPLFERAIAFYRARLVAWFSSRFRVTGSGLSPQELAKHRVRVHIEVGEDLRIVDYRILSSDHPAFDSAARTMLDKLRGESLPPPPENYPGAVQRQLTVTFTCAEDTCD